MKRLLFSLFFVVPIVMLLVSCKTVVDERAPIPEPSVTQHPATLVPTSTKTSIATQLPTNTSTPEPTLTRTASPTPIVLANPDPGYTFYGTQWKHVAENLGWSFETATCGSTFEGVANVYTTDVWSCALYVYPTKEDRSGTDMFLMKANRSTYSSGGNIARPYEFRLYIHKGSEIPSDVDWLSLRPTAVSKIFWEHDVYGVIGQKYGIPRDNYLPSVSMVYPLTAEEYETLLLQPNLFPQWVKAPKYVEIGN